MDLEIFEQDIQATQEYIRNWLEQAIEVGTTSDSQIEPIEELSVSVEELNVAFEELHQQQKELQVANQAINLEKERYQKLFEFSQDGYLITNHTGVIQEANFSAAKMFNRDKERLVGKPLVLFISRSDRVDFYKLLDKSAGATQIQEAILYLRPYNKLAFPVKVSVADVSNDATPLRTLSWSLREQTNSSAALTKPQDRESLPENSPEKFGDRVSLSSTLPISGNQLLRALSDSEYQRLEPHLEIVDLSLGQVLFQPGDAITEVYFPHQAVISLALKLSEKFTTEIIMVGNQGIIGLPVVLGSQYFTKYGIVQIPGSAMKISAELLKNEFHRGETLQRILLLYTQSKLSQVSQLTVCKTHHAIEQQFARWLLLLDDCLEQKTLALTHKAIAEIMGVRRASITVAAQALQKANIISYSRGKITICDRAALEAISCECYSIIKKLRKIS